MNVKSTQNQSALHVRNFYLPQLFFDLLKETTRRIRLKATNHWVFEKIQLSILQNEGEQNVALKIRNKIIPILTSVKIEHLLNPSADEIMKIKVNDLFKLFICKETTSNESLLTLEFTKEVEEKIIVYQVTLKIIDESTQELIGVNKGYGNFLKQPTLNFRTSTEAEKTYRILGELLRADLEPRNSELMSSSSNRFYHSFSSPDDFEKKESLGFQRKYLSLVCSSES